MSLKAFSLKACRYIKSYTYLGNRIIGFYSNFGHGDLGDDASLSAARELFKEHIVPFSKRCYVFNPRMLKSLLIGSGAVLHWQSPYIPRRLLMKDKWNFPVVLFSAGLNMDYKREFSRDAERKIKRLCSICDYLTVKDRITQDFIKKMGFNDVDILPDLELVLKDKPADRNLDKKRLTVGIVLTPHSEFSIKDFEKIVDVFSGFTNYLVDKGMDVLYIPFERSGSDSSKEEEITASILSRVKQKEHVKVLNGDLEPEEVLFVIKKYCDTMVCTRLHSVVFSVNAMVPFLCISYNVMHDGFIEMLDARDLNMSMFGDFSIEGLIEKFNYVMANHDSIKERLRERLSILRDMIYNRIGHIKEIMYRSER